MIRDYTQVMHFCDACVDAASDATDDEGHPSGYLVNDGPDRTYFLIKILCGDRAIYEVPDHTCESNNGACECAQYHTGWDEDENIDSDSVAKEG
jgi:hypothetical protein